MKAQISTSKTASQYIAEINMHRRQSHTRIKTAKEIQPKEADDESPETIPSPGARPV